MQPSPATVPTHSEIEAIVRAVLQRLRAVEVAPAKAPTFSPPGEVRLDQRLVTLEDLRDRWDGMKSLQVPTRCIITPAAKDELRQHGVDVQRFDRAVPQAGAEQLANSSSGLLVVTPAGKKLELSSQLNRLGAEIVTIGQDSSLALNALRKHLAGPQKLCLWSSPCPFADVRACASVPHAAAVQLSRFEDLPLAIEQAQPNVLILDDRRWTASSVANLARTWLTNFRGRSGMQ